MGYHWCVTTDIPQPALATLSHERFWEDGWVYERKLDGQRCLAVRTGRGTKLYSRSGRDVTVAFPEIAEALEEQASTDFVIDGEVVAFEGSRTSFARLQPRIHLSSAEKARRSGVPVYFYVFDVLRADGEDVRGEPLLDRKKRLRDLLTFEGPVRYTPHRRRGGEEYFAEACRKGWEGLIAKRADAAYATGRTDRWLKFKCEAGQELVVVGWTDPEGSRVALGALLLGYHDGDDLVYAGKVGTGFSQSVLRDLHAQLSGLEVDESPCTKGALPRKAVHWARPKLVAQVAFTEWTSANQLRHPRFLGLRDDKPAADVVRERVTTAEVAGVEISRPDKVLFPEDGVTKLDLATYYDAIADVMLPHLRGRPVNMQRFPDGVGAMAFYEKKVPSHFPDWVHTVEVHTEDGTQRQVVVDDRRSLVYLAQQACLTPHTWLCTTKHLEQPDQLVFDLDPSRRRPGEGTPRDPAGGRAARRPRPHDIPQDDRLPRLPRAGPAASRPGLRRGARLRPPVRRGPGREGARPAHPRAAQGQARRPGLRRHRPQRLRPDRGPGVRRPRPRRARRCRRRSRGTSCRG